MFNNQVDVRKVHCS